MTGEDTGDADDRDSDLPERVVTEAERLTRRAREAVDEAERAGAVRARDRLLADHGYTARIRREESREVLVCYPDEWVEDGTIRPGHIDDTDRGIERPLSGAGDEDWETVDAHNRELAGAVEAAHGSAHGANAHALADFAGNHYGKRIEELTGEELSLFLAEYYPRNVWPTDDQNAVVEESIRLVFEQAGVPVPTWRRR
jgi:hypothetical protein